MTSNVHDAAALLLELGACTVGMAVLARLASSWGISAIPLYLIAGLAFGNGGLLPLGLSQVAIRLGAEIGVLLLLFMLGVEYTGEQLRDNLRTGMPAGAADLLLNFPPGFIAGLLLGWSTLPAILLGGVTWISSSGIIAKLLADQKRIGKPETPTVLTILVLEDLAMAVYLPLVAALLIGGSPTTIATSVSIALCAVAVVLFIALRFGAALSSFAEHESDEIVLLTTYGAVLVVAGLAQRFQVSAAIGSFLVGVALSGPIAKQSERLMAPLRDLFAAAFFFFFGMEIDPASLPAVALPAVALGLVTTFTKIGTGWWAAKRAGVLGKDRLLAGIELVSRGEFSIVIASLGIVMEPRLGPVSAAYVLLMAVVGPLLARMMLPKVVEERAVIDSIRSV